MNDKIQKVNTILFQLQRTRAQQSVEELYALFGPVVRHIGLKYLHDPEDTDDFVQDFWADIFSIADRFFVAGNGFAYLCKVATNRAINRYKKRANERAKVIYVDYGQLANKADQSIEQQQVRIMVEDAMKELFEKERIVVQSVFFEHMTLRQIAKELHISKSQASRIKEQALRKLKQLLQ